MVVVLEVWGLLLEHLVGIRGRGRVGVRVRGRGRVRVRVRLVHAQLLSTRRGEAHTCESQNKTCLGPCLLVRGSSPVPR